MCGKVHSYARSGRYLNFMAGSGKRRIARVAHGDQLSGRFLLLEYH